MKNERDRGCREDMKKGSTGLCGKRAISNEGLWIKGDLTWTMDLK